MNRKSTIIPWLGMLAGSIVIAGCSPRLRGLDVPGQETLKDGKVVFIDADGVSIACRQISVPSQMPDDLVGVQIDVVNRRSEPIRLNWRHVWLVDPADARHRPIAPARFAVTLQQAYPYVVETYDYGLFYNAYPYGAYPYRGYYFDGYDTYSAERVEAVSLGLRLWDDRVLEPNQSESGVFIFDFALVDDRRHQVEVEWIPWPAGQAVREDYPAAGARKATFHFIAD